MHSSRSVIRFTSKLLVSLMGCNYASHLANIFLHIHEKTFFQHLQNNHQQDITKFGNLYRFQDDFIIFGMQPHRNLGVHNIYPKEMVIKTLIFHKPK